MLPALFEAGQRMLSSAGREDAVHGLLLRRPVQSTFDPDDLALAADEGCIALAKVPSALTGGCKILGAWVLIAGRVGCDYVVWIKTGYEH